MWGFDSSVPSQPFSALSSRGPGRSPLKAQTGVRIPVALPNQTTRLTEEPGFSFLRGEPELVGTSPRYAVALLQQSGGLRACETEAPHRCHLRFKRTIVLCRAGGCFRGALDDEHDFSAEVCEVLEGLSRRTHEC